MDEREHDQVSLCFCSIGTTTLAFSSKHLKAFIGPESNSDHASGTPLDLAERLALASGAGHSPQAAVLSFRGTERVVRLGSAVRLRSVPWLQLHPLPALVSALREHAGLAGVVLEGQSFALLIDFESLSDTRTL